MPSDAAPPAAGPRRLHPLSILFGVGRSARIFLLPGLILLVAAQTSGLDTWLMVLALPSAISSILSWYRFRYLLTDDEIVVRTGLLFRRERHIPYVRIQDVRMVQGPLQRLFGVAELRIETGGGEEAEAAMRVLSTGAIEEIRQRHAMASAKAPAAPEEERSVKSPGSTSTCAGLPGPRLPTAAGPPSAQTRARPDGRQGPAAGSGSPSPPEARANLSEAPAILSEAPASMEKESEARPTPAAPHDAAVALVHLSPGDVVLAGLTRGRGWLAVAAAAGIAWEGSALLKDADLLDLDWSGLAWSMLTGWFRSPGQILWMALIVLGAFVLMRLLSVVWALLTFHDFSLTRKGGGFVVSAGLLTRTTATIPRHRVQSIGVSETWLQRLAGVVSVRARTAGGREEDDSESAGHWIAPSLPREDFPRVLKEVLPEVDLAGLRFLPVHPGARRRLLREWLWVLAGVSIASCAALGPAGLILPALLLPLGLIDSRRGAAALGYAVGERAVVFKKGWWVRRLLAVTSTKVQAIKMTRSPFDRRGGMATLAIDTAGGGSDETGMSLPYLPAEAASELLALLTRRAARSRFRW